MSFISTLISEAGGVSFSSTYLLNTGAEFPSFPSYSVGSILSYDWWDIPAGIIALHGLCLSDWKKHLFLFWLSLPHDTTRLLALNQFDLYWRNPEILARADPYLGKREKERERKRERKRLPAFGPCSIKSLFNHVPVQAPAVADHTLSWSGPGFFFL